MSTITLTFGDQAENHHGMQKIGNLSEKGFTYDDLIAAKTIFEEKGIECELVVLDKETDAYFLIARNGVSAFCSVKNLWLEQLSLDPDKKALMRGRVVNKKARWNLCFSEFSQEANFEEGKGTVIDYSSVKRLKKLRNRLHRVFGDKAKKLECEGNYYYDIEKCYIGFHGDSERKKVIGVRLGDTFPFYFQWYQHSEPISEKIKFELNHGDIYCMSEKAVGNDWKRRTIKTLRHAAGNF